jgi:hypothetical protein
MGSGVTGSSCRRTPDRPTLEETRFLRDETANMAWAIEVATAGRLGEPIPGFERAVTAAAEAPAANATALRYQIQTDVPAYWIPFVPVTVASSTREIALELAALLPTLGPEGTPPGNPGAIRQDPPSPGGGRGWVPDPRGAGEGWSGLRFDLARPPRS